MLFGNGAQAGTSGADTRGPGREVRSSIQRLHLSERNEGPMSTPAEHAKRDLVLDAIAHKETWRIPHRIECQPALGRALAERYGVEDVRTVLGNAVEWITDASVDYLSDPNMLCGGEYTDPWGVGWHGVGESRGQVKSPPLREPTIQGYHFPEQFPARTLERMKRQIGDSQGLYHLSRRQFQTSGHDS